VERTREQRHGASVAVRQVRAERMGGEHAEGERLSIGSARDADLVIDDPTVSRYHVELAADPRGIAVRDLGSTNGVIVEGVRLASGVVPPGAVLELGSSRVRVLDASSRQESIGAERMGPFVARAPAMRRFLARLARASASEAVTLVTGESGTGKELVARTLHEQSARAKGPLVVLDCGALPPTLVASELFGHERGAFTDAAEQRRGALERASGGTLFLDEIGELPLEVQPALLGALERRAARRVGGSEEVRFDVRVIAATHRDLRREVNAGAFRLDLYYRLAVMKLEVPPLRERADDVPLLVRQMLDELGVAGEHPQLPPERVEELAARAWPGNVRELRNVIEAVVALDEWAAEPPADGEAIDETFDALVERLAQLPWKQARASAAAELETAYLERLRARAGANVSRAARLAGLDRSQLRTLLARRGISLRD
jgi:DNA-binding NtrC family response regulator